MVSYKKIMTFGWLYLVSLSAFGNDKVRMADIFREEGKIYVVVAIIVTILIGLLGYLILLERRIHRFEKNVKKRKEK